MTSVEPVTVDENGTQHMRAVSGSVPLPRDGASTPSSTVISTEISIKFQCRHVPIVGRLRGLLGARMVKARQLSEGAR